MYSFIMIFFGLFIICHAFIAVDNRDLLAPLPLKDGRRGGSVLVKGVDFDPSPYRVLRRILLDYLEVDPGIYKCINITN